MNMSPTNRKDSLFMSLPASFQDNNVSQYAPFFDLSLLSANSAASCFLPTGIQHEQYTTTTPAQEPPFSANNNQNQIQSPAFDFLQYSDFIAPFPSTPQPAFLNFPQTPRFSGTFTIAPQAILATPSSSASAFFPMQQTTADEGRDNYQQQQCQQAMQAPLNQPTRPLPRRARNSSASSDTGSIIIKDIEGDDDEEEEEEEEEAEGDNTAHPNDGIEQHNAEEEEQVDDERFALFASQVRRKAEAMSLQTSQMSQATAPTPSKYHEAARGVTAPTTSSDLFEWPNNAALAAGIEFELNQRDALQRQQIGAGASSLHKVDRSRGQVSALTCSVIIFLDLPAMVFELFDHVLTFIQYFVVSEYTHITSVHHYIHSLPKSTTRWSANLQQQQQVQVPQLPPMPTPLPPLPPQYRIENGLYTDQYSSFPLSDDFDMGVSPTKSEKPRRGHHSRFPPPLFLCPKEKPNCF